MPKAAKPKKKPRAGPLSLAPLTFEQAIRRALSTPIPGKPKPPRAKRRRPAPSEAE